MARITYVRFEPIRFHGELRLRSSFNKSPSDPLATQPFELLYTIRKWRVRREGDETILVSWPGDAP